MTRIRSVRPISVRYPEPNDAGAIRHLTLCRIEADDGTVGWGEAVTSWPDACRATEALIDGIGAELVVGRDPLDNVDIWRACRRRAWWYGNRGGISSLVSDQVRVSQRWWWQRQSRLSQISVVGRPATGRSRTRTGRRPCAVATALQPGQPTMSFVVSTASSSSPSCSSTATSRNPSSPRTTAPRSRAPVASVPTWGLPPKCPCTTKSEAPGPSPGRG